MEAAAQQQGGYRLAECNLPRDRKGRIGYAEYGDIQERDRIAGAKVSEGYLVIKRNLYSRRSRKAQAAAGYNPYRLSWY